jgi:hypothetical protein
MYSYLQDLPGYAREATGTSVVSLFSQETLETLFPKACTEFALVLGTGLLYPKVPHLPLHMRLDFWQHSVRIARVQAKIVLSPLMLPDGSHPASLEICETIETAENLRDLTPTDVENK